jgi:hypothetical protein
MLMNSILIGVCCLQFAIIVFLIYKLYQFSLLIIDMEDSIEASLDLLDEKYKRMYDILQKPIFFDSVEVRQVISDIKDCQNSILLVANTITKNIGYKGEEAKEENSKEKEE